MADDASTEHTHDWAKSVDADHLTGIRRHPRTYAPGGVLHLVLEVLAYPAEEAEHNRGGRCDIVLYPDGSVSVSDNGRGTATRTGSDRAVRKPIMATRDLRFFDSQSPPLLPDGHPRRGISVVAALSDWLVHTNRRPEGAWTRRYRHGVPVTGLESVPSDGNTGTSVRFLANAAVRASGVAVAGLAGMAASWPALSVDVRDLRNG